MRELISALLDGRPLLFLDTARAGAFLPDGGGTVFVGFISKHTIQAQLVVTYIYIKLIRLENSIRSVLLNINGIIQ